MATRVEAPLEGRVTRPRIEAPPCVTVVFGASGDLTRRKLGPALYNLEGTDALPDRWAMVGVARRPWGHPTGRRSP